MAETQTWKWDEAAFNKEVERINGLVKAKSGMKNYNAHIWFKSKVEPVLAKISGGAKTKENFDALVSLKEVTKLNPAIADPIEKSIVPSK